MWPEALARAQGVSEEPVIFPSDLDEDLPRPIVASFYSLRGGVGRSTALAYTAQILASRGPFVLCVDMDLEAPALAALFSKEDEISHRGQGLVSILLALDQGEKPDIVQHIIRLSESDELYCLPAGIPNADYARRLRLLDPEGWYREGHEIRCVPCSTASLTGLPFKPDLVLMDARTGITPMSAPAPLRSVGSCRCYVLSPSPKLHGNACPCPSHPARRIHDARARRTETDTGAQVPAYCRRFRPAKRRKCSSAIVCGLSSGSLTGLPH